MNNSAKKITVFVCVKVRDPRKSSCGGCGAREILNQLRANLSPVAADLITIRPSGCLKKCKKGPAVVVLRTKGESLKKPPQKAWKKAKAKFKRVRSEEVEEVLQAAQTLLQKSATKSEK